MKYRVLVVDDEADALKLLRMVLELSGYEPVTTVNSIEAIAIAEKEKPDVVLLDIMMPVLDGFELCKMMRQNPVTKDLPIIFVTAYSALDLEERRTEAGADMVINKPINMDMLKETITKAITMRVEQTDIPAAGTDCGDDV
ncbi:MAG: response regulator [Anaerolineae bacterium]|nr:response regulator [Anaerolineae bacterium]